MLDLPPPPLWLPTKPAIIRPATAELLRAHDPLKSSLPGLVPLIGGATPKQPIEFIGASNTNTLPAHQAGDLLIVFAVEIVTGVAPGLASGWTDLGTATTGGNTLAVRAGYLIATGSSTPFGTWTNADRYGALVYRNASGIGAIAITNNQSGTNRTYPALTLQTSDNTSWVVRYGWVRNSSDQIPPSTLPTGYTSRFDGSFNNGGEGEGRAWRGGDTDGPVSSVSAASVSNGGTRNWHTFSIEILN